MKESVLDTDLYKFSMSYAYMMLYPEAEGTFTFVDRGNTNYTKEFLDSLKLELAKLEICSLTDREAELAYSKTSKWIPRFYWEWLKSFRFDTNKIKVSLVRREDGTNNLSITVTDLLYKATLYEVHILALVSYLRGEMLGLRADMNEVIERLKKKVDFSNKNGLPFSEFGTRRRFSQSVQEEVVKYLSSANTHYCLGTSNLMLAIKYNMTPIGTMAHEFVSFHASQYGYRQANYMSMKAWSKVYHGLLGVYLPDTFGLDTFLSNLSVEQAKLWDGVRHDSGDPYMFVTKVIRRYKELGIDPKSKTMIFSNALDMESWKDIYDYCKGRVGNLAAGIGTNLTNDTGNEIPNLVMKLTAARMNFRKDWVPCIKISDDLGKHTGDPKEIDLACKTLGLKI